MNKATALNGLLVIDKPLRMTSRDAVNRAWGWLPRGTRIGHTGTLDPLATGVLVLCIGAATRLAEYVQRMEKVYRGEIRLGTRSSTDDGEGTLTDNLDSAPPDKEVVASTLNHFIGRIDQIPPDYSAAKVTGRRAYALARQGMEVNLTSKPVMVHAITLLEYAYPRLDVEVRCGKGTYIRALARDLGERLGCGAYLENLRRKRVGTFLSDEALSLDTDRETACSKLLPLYDAVKELPTLLLNEEQGARLQNGLGVPIQPGMRDGEEIAVLSAAGRLLAVGRVMMESGMVLPEKVFL